MKTTIAKKYRQILSLMILGALVFMCANVGHAEEGGVEPGIKWINEGDVTFEYDGQGHAPQYHVEHSEGFDEKIRYYEGIEEPENWGEVETFTEPPKNTGIYWMQVCLKKSGTLSNNTGDQGQLETAELSLVSENSDILGSKRFIIAPKKNLVINIGQKASVQSIAGENSNVVFSIDNATTVKNFFVMSSDGKTFVTKQYYKDKIPVSISVTAKVGEIELGKTNVRVRIPAPKASVSKKSKKIRGIKAYRYTFKYQIPGANRVEVTLVHGNKKAKRVLNKYVQKPNSNKNSYITLSKVYAKKVAKKTRKNGKIEFRVTAYYGGNINKSETTTILK